MTNIQITAHETGVTRVFALSLSDAAAQELRADPAAQASMLGLDQINPTGMEVFRVADLGQMGLLGYLREGVDVDAGDLTRDRARLSALEGWVMLAHSSAFSGQAAQLSPLPEATLIGTYAQTGTDRSSMPLDTDAAKPYTGTPQITPAQAPKGRAGGAMVVAGLVVIAALILWWALN